MGHGVPTAHRRLPGGNGPLKVLDVTEFYSPLGGGVRTYLTSKSRWIAAQSGIEHVVVVSSDRDDVTRWHASTVHTVAGPPVPASPGYHFFLGGPRLRDIVRAEHPDVVEVGSPFAVPWLLRYAMRGSRAALIGFLHSDLRSVWIRHLLAKRAKAVRRSADAVLTRYLANVYGSCDRVIAASSSAARAIDHLGTAAPLVIPLGVDLGLFHPDKRDPQWKREIGAGDADPVALYVGRLSREKGIDTVLEALPDLHARHRLKVVIVGTGHMRPQVESFAARHADQLTVLPYQERRTDLARIYASADLLIAPCPYETFGIAAVEGMASGLPVAGVTEGAIGDLIRGAAWARGFEAGCPHSMADAVTELLTGGCRSLGRGARAAAERDFSWDRTFGKLMAAYLATPPVLR